MRRLMNAHENKGLTVCWFIFVALPIHGKPLFSANIQFYVSSFQLNRPVFICHVFLCQGLAVHPYRLSSSILSLKPARALFTRGQSLPCRKG